MPNLYIVIGEAETRKSSCIRALSGVCRRKSYEIATQNAGDIDIYIPGTSSLQERGISPDDFMDEVKRNSSENVLMSLWISATSTQPDGHTYIQRFITSGWSIKEIVVLGENHLNLPANCPHPHFIPKSPIMPANAIAAQIREQWQWL
ncbi:MAG: hypothetical protein V1784_06850 [bacterium]